MKTTTHTEVIKKILLELEQAVLAAAAELEPGGDLLELDDTADALVADVVDFLAPNGRPRRGYQLSAHYVDAHFDAPDVDDQPAYLVIIPRPPQRKAG